MIACRNCRAVLVPGTLFCPECGLAVSTSPVRRPPSSRLVGELARPQDGQAQAADDGLGGKTWRVTLVIEPSGRRLRFNLNEPIRVGREDPQRGTQPDVDLSGDQGVEFGVSRLHATIQVLADRVVVMDLGSKNGTVLNRQPLRAEMPYPLQSGDEVCFGRLPVHVFVESGD